MIFIMFESIPMRNAPAIVPESVPYPPESAVPPIAAAVIESRSKEEPIKGSPIRIRQARIIPVIAAVIKEMINAMTLVFFTLTPIVAEISRFFPIA